MKTSELTGPELDRAAAGVTKTVKIKTSEITGPVLDWAVAKCEKPGITGQAPDGKLRAMPTSSFGPTVVYSPSTDWSQGGSIIEREGICTRFDPKDARGAWYAVVGQWRFLSPDFEGSGPTLLIAAMRCYCQAKLGEEVDIPEELK